MNEEKGLVLLSELDILSNWDRSITSRDSVELCQRSGALVSAAVKSEDYTFLIKAWACWSFYETIIGNKQKWQMTRIINPRTGEIPPLAESWVEFGMNHLGMAKSTVSGYKSIWSTYVEKLEIDLSRLALAGKSKLLVAQGLIKDMWPGQNQELLNALFDPDVTLATLTSIVQRLRNEMDDKKDDDDEEESDIGSFEGDLRYDDSLKTIHWVGWFIHNGNKYPLREWVVDVLNENVVGEGVPDQIRLILMEAIGVALGVKP